MIMECIFWEEWGGYHEKGSDIISIVIESPQDIINTLAGENLESRRNQCKNNIFKDVKIVKKIEKKVVDILYTAMVR